MSKMNLSPAYGGYFVVMHSVTHCFLSRALSPFAFRVIIDRFVLSAIFITAFCHFHYSVSSMDQRGWILMGILPEKSRDA